MATKKERGEKNNPIIIMYDSEQAAHEATIIIDGAAQTCWVSRSGRFYFGDKARHLAKYDGCTHRTCFCGQKMEKHYTRCATCREVAAMQRYDNRDKAQWDGEVPLYSDAADRYFNSFDEIDGFLEDEGGSIDGLRLIICEPNFAREIDPDEYYLDDLPEDCSVPAEIADAFEALNKAIRECKQPLSWVPGKFAAIC
jgi:hypothetical protein